MLDCYEAFSDSPIPKYFKQIDELYPESKFILTKRNKISWLSSMKWMLSDGKAIFAWDTPTHRYHQEFYGTSKYKKELLSKFWEDYHSEVLKYFTNKSNLLVIDIDEGFKIDEICDFLQIPNKEVIIKKKNSRRSATFRQRVRYFKLRIKE